MAEWVARTVRGGEELHLVVIDEVYGENNEPYTLFVHADHYSSRRHLEQAYFWSLEAAQADCRARFGVGAEDWRPADTVRFGYTFRFDYGMTNLGVPQPYPLDFDGAEVVFRLGEVAHPDAPPTPVLDITGNQEGLRRLAALLLLCAEEGFYRGFYEFFHVHLYPGEPEEPGKPPFFHGDIDVTLRAPSYLDALRAGPLQQWSMAVDLGDDDGEDEDDEDDDEDRRSHT